MVWVWCWFPSGSLTVAPQLGVDVPPVTSPTECGEVTGGVEIAVQHEAALAAGVGAFGQALCGYHRAAVRTGFGTGIPPVRDVHPHTRPTGFVLHLIP
jgi:hypothetical protein